MLRTSSSSRIFLPAHESFKDVDKSGPVGKDNERNSPISLDLIALERLVILLRKDLQVILLYSSILTVYI